MIPAAGVRNIEKKRQAEIEAELLRKRLREKKRNIEDIWGIFDSGHYFVLNICINAMICGYFYTVNTEVNIVGFSPNEYRITTPYGQVIEMEHSDAFTDEHTYRMQNGDVPFVTILIIKRFANLMGAFVAMATYKFPIKTKLISLSIACVFAQLLHQVSMYHHFDRISYLIEQLCSKAIMIIGLLATYESGPHNYRMIAIGIQWIWAYIFTYFDVLLHKKEDMIISNTVNMLFVSFVSVTYVLLCPPQLYSAIVRRDINTIRQIIARHGNEAKSKATNLDAVVDDVIYSGHYPINGFDGLMHLAKIKPFRNKMIALSLINCMQYLGFGMDKEIIRHMLPFTPNDAIVFSRTISLLTVIFMMMFGSRVSRRVLIISFLVLNILITLSYLTIDLVDTNMCFEVEHSTGNQMEIATYMYVIFTVVRTGFRVLIAVMIFDHIPGLYRSFVYPLVIVVESTVVLLSQFILGNGDSGQATNLTQSIYFLFSALFLAILFVDNSTFSPLSTSEIPCYRLAARNSSGEIINVKRKRGDVVSKERVSRY